jgi:histone acetyltransferase (RNA polymerase elongator complex component)
MTIIPDIDVLLSINNPHINNEVDNQSRNCQCIYCCEVNEKKYNKNEITYYIKPFTTSDIQEYFIYAKVDRPITNILLGFIHIRLENNNMYTSIICKLNIYGSVKQDELKNESQHFEISKNLLTIAESISSKAGYKNIANISKSGICNYYTNNGYTLMDKYIIKNIEQSELNILWLISILIIIIATIFNNINKI